MKKLNILQQMAVDTGMLVIALPVTHDLSENEIQINTYCLCDMCGEYYDEDEMKPTIADAAVCIHCWEHYN